LIRGVPHRAQNGLLKRIPPTLVPSAPTVPIYEYRCPNGHLFERFQPISAPAPEVCDVCGAAPVELVLYPVAIHYKGSGFYTTDYGKGKGAKKDGEGAAAKGDGGSGSSGSSESSSGSGSTEKKAAASGD
jgi:putative FmdB family regulatory protein